MGLGGEDPVAVGIVAGRLLLPLEENALNLINDLGEQQATTEDGCLRLGNVQLNRRNASTTV